MRGTTKRVRSNYDFRQVLPGNNVYSSYCIISLEVSVGTCGYCTISVIVVHVYEWD